MSQSLEVVTTNQAATLHDVSPATIRSWVLRGLLHPYAKVEGVSFYRVEDVDHAEMLARSRDVSGRSQKRME